MANYSNVNCISILFQCFQMFCEARNSRRFDKFTLYFLENCENSLQNFSHYVWKGNPYIEFWCWVLFTDRIECSILWHHKCNLRFTTKSMLKCGNCKLDRTWCGSDKDNVLFRWLLFTFLKSKHLLMYIIKVTVRPSVCPSIPLYFKNEEPISTHFILWSTHKHSSITMNQMAELKFSNGQN